MAGAALAWSVSPTMAAKLRVPTKPLCFGLIADVHIGFIEGAEQRLASFLAAMKQVNPDALVQLGDFAYPNAKHQASADTLNAAHEKVIHVIGNHDLDHGLKRQDAVKAWGMPGRYYAMEVQGVKVIVLDGNDRGSPTYSSHGGYHCYIGPDQQKWLEHELKVADVPVVVFSHQALAGHGSIDNAEDLQTILSEHQEKVLLAVNGHSHLDAHLEIRGVHYVHLNSASYYWVGGKRRLLTYRDPLFATLTIDFSKMAVKIEGRESRWLDDSPEEIGYFKDKKRAGMKNLVQPKISSRSW